MGHDTDFIRVNFAMDYFFFYSIMTELRHVISKNVVS